MRIVADFETTIDVPVRVYYWYAFIEDTREYFKGRDIESFIDFIESYPQSDIFFHNAKFDGSYIVDYLVKKHKIQHNCELDVRQTHYIQGDFDNFTYYFGYGRYVNVKDSLSLLTGSLAQFGASIGLVKGDTSKDAYYTSSQVESLSTDEIERLDAYCKRDVEILAKIMREYKIWQLSEIAGTKAKLAYLGLTSEELTANTYTIKPWNTLNVPEEERVVKSVTCEWTVVLNKHTKKTQHFPTFLWETFHTNKKRNYEVLGTNKALTRDIEIGSDWTIEYLKEYRKSFKSKVIQLEPFTFYTQKHVYERFSKQADYKLQKKILTESNKLAKSSYKGGINYVNPAYQNKWLHKTVYQYDINSMYPWIYSTKRMPDALDRTPVDKLNKSDLGLVCIGTLKATCKQGRMPLIKLKTNTFSSEESVSAFYSKNIDEYLPEVDIQFPFNLTNLEYQYLLENYEIHSIQVMRMFKFGRNRKLEQAFASYCSHWYREKAKGKEKDDAVKTYFAKLMLNALYGKFGQYESEYERFSYVLEDDELIKEIECKYQASMYEADVLVASYITAYGRVYLAETINAIGLENFVYCDTDSIHSFIPPDRAQELGVKIGDKLGEFKLEGKTSESKYIQPKTYGYEFEEYKHGEWSDKAWTTICAGFNDKIPKEKFESGLVTTAKRVKLVEGGYQIIDQELELGAKLRSDQEIKLARLLSIA